VLTTFSLVTMYCTPRLQYFFSSLCQCYWY